jgi:hypothetical protein
MGPLPPLAPPTLIRGAGALMLGVGALMLAQPTSFWGSRTRGGRLVRRTPSPPGAVWELVALPRRSVLCGVSCAWCVRPAHGGVGGPPAAAAGAAASERAARAAPHRPAARARETPKKVRTSSRTRPLQLYKVQQFRCYRSGPQASDGRVRRNRGRQAGQQQQAAGSSRQLTVAGQ